MEQNLKLDKTYLEGFNLGYELAKELNLSVPLFNGLNTEVGHLVAINDGVEQYLFEISLGKTKGNDIGQHFVKNKEKGFGQSF